jgi:tetratricopeptide (TPR) repeat protein
MRLMEEAGDLDGLSQAMVWVARGHELLGRTDEALRVYRRRLLLAADSANALSPSVRASTALAARGALGRLYIGKGEWDAALEILAPVVALGRESAVPALQALALAGLGEAL